MCSVRVDRDAAESIRVRSAAKKRNSQAVGSMQSARYSDAFFKDSKTVKDPDGLIAKVARYKLRATSYELQAAS